VFAFGRHQFTSEIQSKIPIRSLGHVNLSRHSSKFLFLLYGEYSSKHKCTPGTRY
jgi:hypothetical protein